ncbi:MAG: hypothetical protein JW818_07175 [Pirellulales bacterium]|nr:hypothetical protein [Pirellulales bacterium]
MPNAYKQVALTYLRRPFSSWIGVCMFIGALGMIPMGIVCLLEGGRGRPPAPAFFPVVMLFLFLYWSLAMHMKDQFADSRARLTPGFRRVHVVVAGTAILVCVVLLPGVVALAGGLRSVGLVALSVLFFDAVLWQVVSNSSWIALVLLAGWAGAMTDPIRAALGDFISGKLELQAVVLLLAGVVIAGQTMLRLVRLTEDDPKRYRRIQWDNLGRIRLAGHAWQDDTSLRQRFRNRAIDQGLRVLTRHALAAPTSWWSRVRRWPIGAVTPLSIWSQSLFMFIVLQIMTWFIPDLPGEENEGKMITLLPMLIMVFLIPSFSLFGMLSTRRPLMGRELLLPVTRRDYVRQLGGAALVNFLQIWVTVTVTMVVWWLLNRWRAPLESGVIIHLLFYSVVVQVLAFGLVVWATSLRSRVSAYATLIVAIAGSQFVGMVCLMSPQDLPEYALPLIGATLAVIGLVFLWHGHHRWLAADFD